MNRTILITTLVIAAALIGYNQFQINSVRGSLADMGGTGPDLAGVDPMSLMSTAQSVNAVFPELSAGMSQDEIVSTMLPKGTPSYGDALGGITFDRPEKSLAYLNQWHPALKAEVESNDPDAWQRYLDLAAAPRGISCEYCCGIGPQGIDSNGNSMCGCQHNPALQAIALGLISETDMSDAQVLREVMRWKTLFFPQDMVRVASSVAGADASDIEGLPGMVGGC